MADETKSIEKRLEYQKRLNTITNEIHAAGDTNEILLNLQGRILGLFDADRITIFVVDREKRQLVSLLKTGDEVQEIRVGLNKKSIAGFCGVTGKILNIADVYDDQALQRISPDLRFDRSWDERTGYRTRQVLVSPIVHARQLLGVIQLLNKTHGTRFTRDDHAALLDILKVLGLAFYKNQKLAQQTKPTKFDFLLTHNIVSGNELNQAMSRARSAQKSVESVLMSDFSVSKADIGKSLANHYRTRFIPYVDRMVIPAELIKGLKASFLKTNAFVPVGQADGKVIVVMEDPDYLPARDAIKRFLPGREFEFCVSLREDIHKMISHFFDLSSKEMLSGTGSIEDILGQLDTSEDEGEEEARGGMSENDSAIVRLINKMIADAYSRNASDIHIEPRQGKASAVVRFRIDGACQVYQTIPYTHKRAMVSRLKIMSDLDISERRLPQDGKIKFSKFAPLDIELRVATIPTAGQNEDVVMRILSASKPMPLKAMGMTQRDYDETINMITLPYGIVLVVGPTGSGKTTTLHAALHYINTPEKKIWTAEDPVEITQEGLRQVQVYPKIGFDFARAMRSFLRADPDVIMVGEMRDRETMTTGIEASLTGHLVFSTLHTNSAAETITRLLDMGMDPFNFADALLGVIAQRLARTLCPKCKEKYHPSQEEYDALVRAYGKGFEQLGVEYNEDFCLYRPKGCPECNQTGYAGRTALHEVLVGTDEIQQLIQGRARIREILNQAVADGMTTLMQDGIRKVCQGITDFTQVRSVCIR
ncbi:MAG: GspE/PulE family protein [Deltaproteobacteria bacterium]|nr:GspE/PulE family protein [Deltaproteobacteria bacterium]MCF8119097.1 GspE/PulE family protein [Deltaproteobacteria bacterium]